MAFQVRDFRNLRTDLIRGVLAAGPDFLRQLLFQAAVSEDSKVFRLAKNLWTLSFVTIT